MQDFKVKIPVSPLKKLITSPSTLWFAWATIEYITYASLNPPSNLDKAVCWHKQLVINIFTMKDCLHNKSNLLSMSQSHINCKRFKCEDIKEWIIGLHHVLVNWKSIKSYNCPLFFYGRTSKHSMVKEWKLNHQRKR